MQRSPAYQSPTMQSARYNSRGGCARRRMTNRESAQRMRKKRQEDFDSVVTRLAEAETENARLVQVCDRMGMFCSAFRLVLRKTFCKRVWDGAGY